MTSPRTWQDGPAHLARLLADTGKLSILDHAKEHENVSLDQLADTLQVAPIVVQMRYEEEARSAKDPRALAEDLLARRLLNVTEGWPSVSEWETMGDIRYHIIAWCAMMKNTPFENAQKEIFSKLINSKLPAGWRPMTSRDPIIGALFNDLWRTS